MRIDVNRRASSDEIAAEMDRRGAVIEKLEAEVARLRDPVSDEGLVAAIARAIARVQLNGGDPDQPAVRWNGTQCEPQDFPAWHDFRDEARAVLSAVAGPLRAQAEDDAFDAAVRAAVRAGFGAPSMWGGDRPDGWHLDRPCTPEEAAHHDNGIVDAVIAIRRAQGALKGTAPAPQPAIPEGWKLVPVGPTWEMQIAGRDAILNEDDYLDLSTDDARAAYLAMLAAAPEPPAGKGGEHG